MVTRIRVIRFAFRVVLAWGAACLGSAAEAGCNALLPSGASGPVRDVTATDLIELREIGYPDAAITGDSPLAVSPDGSEVAFVLSRANVAANNYCRGLVLVPLNGGSPRLLDSGGEFIPLQTFIRGLMVTVGLPRLVVPVWSPDGRSIGYLKREQGVTQAFVVDVQTGNNRVVTHSPTNVEELRWSPDGSALLFRTRPGVAETRKLIAGEGSSGWLYDSRVAPNYGATPQVREEDALPATLTVDLRSGIVRKAPIAAAISSVGRETQRPLRRVWTKPDGDSLVAPERIWATNRAGKPIRCGAQSCSGRILRFWWDSGASAVRYIRSEGWDGEATAFYRWKPGEDAPVRTFTTTDAIENCAQAAERLACTIESATLPRRVILLDPESGEEQLVFDPNPEFRRIRLGSVKRLHFRNNRGLPAWGDLVLPPGSKRSSHLPLVIVQYHSRGFLRGGTGDEYPIYLLAAHGLAVLSFERPRAVSDLIPGLKTEAALNAADQREWTERRSLLSSLLAGVDSAVKTGWIDPRRIGITGLSDGATSARFALINSRRFVVAAISSCCLEPKTVMTYGGIAWAKFNRASGYPPATRTNPHFWRPMALSLNASKLKIPLLMQLSDDEYLLALEAFEALREYRAPTELFVFPGEHHVKWQPVHRLAIYNRNLDWFNFWLRCREDPDPSKKAQYQRWEAMRLRTPATSRLCPITPNSEPTPQRR